MVCVFDRERESVIVTSDRFTACETFLGKKSSKTIRTIGMFISWCKPLSGKRILTISTCKTFSMPSREKNEIIFERKFSLTTVDFYKSHHPDWLPREICRSEEKNLFFRVYFETTSTFCSEMFFITRYAITLLIFWNETFRSNRLWTRETGETMFVKLLTMIF